VLSAILLGLIEGLTEFLPISSTGHLLIAEYWLGRRSDLFNIVIQAGAILAVTLVFRQRLYALMHFTQDTESKDYLLKLLLAFVVTAALGIPMRLLGWQLPDSLVPIAWALLIGGVLMLIIERFTEQGIGSAQVTWQIAVWAGVAQVIAGIFPGTSRSAAGIFIVMLAGLNRRSAAAEFVFLLGIPTMFAASCYALLEYSTQQNSIAENFFELAVAFAAASASGFMAVRWLMQFIQSRSFAVFAWYRIILGLILLASFGMQWRW